MPLSIPVAAIVSQPPAAPDTCFILGQDPQGRWVTVEVHGRAGGLFRTCHDALHCATEETRRRPDAVLTSTDLIELQL